MSKKATITFYGGAGSVTGANFLLDTGTIRVLVDCGIEQRENACDPVNHAPFVYDPSTIQMLVVTHAHADHIGRIPKLVHDGFAGTIVSTSATKELAALMFADAIHVMEHDAQKCGADLLYDMTDVERTLSLWETHGYHEPFPLGDATAEFLDAGHILGSAMVKCVRNGKTLIFSGDLGNSPEPLLNDTEIPTGADYILMESVYGDRVHEEVTDRVARLRAVIDDVIARNGTLLIPSFSIERTQVLLFEIGELVEKHQIRSIPVYLDAPLAIRVTQVFRNHVEMFNSKMQAHFKKDDPFDFPGLELILHTEESRKIHELPNPKIIIAGAGMSSGGRVRAHERQYLSDPNATQLFVGYQAPGSLGRRIQDGASEVTIDGERIKVRAHIETLSGYSGHRDREGLLSFVEGAGDTLKRVFVTMGEPGASQFLAQRIRDFLDVDAIVPTAGECVEIDW